MNRSLPRPIAALALLSALGTPLSLAAEESADTPAVTLQRSAPLPALVGPAAPALGLAAKLAAAQTYLGITSDQEAVWRDYTQALIGFVEPPLPATAEPPGSGDPAFEAERMAHIALAQAETARALLDAATALRGALDPVQVQRLKQAEPSFAPPPPQPGPERRPWPRD